MSVVIDISQADLTPEEREEGYEIASMELLKHISLAIQRPQKAVVTLDRENDQWNVELVGLAPNIARTRRITGYCSTTNQFNAAKLAELSDRKKHMKINVGEN